MTETLDDEPGARTALFQQLRPALTGLAYRMLGAVSEAEDIVQDAWLRWQSAPAGRIVREPRAYLYQVVTRLCLDHLKSARVRRESYVGCWLPEPVLDEAAVQPAGGVPALAHDLSFALLLTLERLTPGERAAFLLHDVFELGFAEVSEALGQSEPACRQLAARARAHLREPAARFRPSAAASEKLISAFLAAATGGDLATLRGLLTEDAIYYSDGGGRVSTALNPIVGADRVARFLIGVLTKFPPPADARARPTLINGLPGLLLVTPQGVLQTLAFELTPEGRVARLYSTRNPDKLAHLALD